MLVRIGFFLLMMAVFVTAFSSNCPDPNSSSLAWGEIPSPWELSPFSPNVVQADPTMAFKKANILMAGLGQGIACTYTNSLGYVSIWWQIRVRTPSFNEPYWAKTNGGYVCSMGINECSFLEVVE